MVFMISIRVNLNNNHNKANDKKLYKLLTKKKIYIYKYIHTYL